MGVKSTVKHIIKEKNPLVIAHRKRMRRELVNREVGNVLQQNHLNGSREYERYLDFVKWFNEADGKFISDAYRP